MRAWRHLLHALIASCCLTSVTIINTADSTGNSWQLMKSPKGMHEQASEAGVAAASAEAEALFLSLCSLLFLFVALSSSAFYLD